MASSIGAVSAHASRFSGKRGEGEAVTLANLLYTNGCSPDSRILARVREMIASGIQLEADGALLKALQEQISFAITHNYLESVELYIDAGLSLDFEINGKSPLQMAAQRSNASIGRLVREHTKGADRMLPALEAILRLDATEELLAAHPPTQIEVQVLNTKAIAHFFNITGKMPGFDFSLENSYEIFTSPYLQEALIQFSSTPRFGDCQIGEKLQVLSDAYGATDVYGSDDEETVRKIQEGELCFVNTGWIGHAITLCFMDGYMAICNRGKGSDLEGTLRVFKIDPSRVTRELLSQIRAKKGVSYEEGKRFLYVTLPDALGGQQDIFSRSFNGVAPKLQKIPNCALASPKSAIRFAWIMLLRRQGVEEPFDVGRKESKIFTDFAARYLLDKVGRETVPGFRGTPEVERALERKCDKMVLRQRPRLIYRVAMAVAAALPFLSSLQ